MTRPGRTPPPEAAGADRWSPRGALRLGWIALAVLVLCLGGWSATARISGAVIASGMVQVEGNRQSVQHPDGGLVGEILVQDGDRVAAGDVLLRFDAEQMRSDLAVIEGQLFEILARKARLRAERDGAARIDFPEELLARAAGDGEVAELIEGQRSLFRARARTREDQVAQLRGRIGQTREQIAGLRAQIDALSEERALIEEELADQQTLLDRGLTQASRVLSLRRERARLGGRLGELRAAVAEARARIAETEIEILGLESQLREDAITRLRDLGYNEIELRERRGATRRRLGRLEVRAPVAGVIYDRRVNTEGAVVRPADVIMYVVPQDQPLVITARVEAINIDEVQVGQPASLRFPAFAQRTTPELEGRVTRVSADAFTDETTGQVYYSAELLPREGELAKLSGREILPGMPVEAYIRTGERTPLNYLVKPMSDYFNRAFRES